MNRQSSTQFLKITIYLTLMFSTMIPEAMGSISAATQDSWVGGLPNSRPFVAPWSDMFESSYAVDWSDTPASLTITSGFERQLLWNTGGLWTTGFTPSDIDSDGDLDLFVLLHPNQVGWLENSEREQDWVFHEIQQLIYQPKALVSSDFDGNGSNDLAVSSREDGLIVLYQYPDDRWVFENIDRQFYRGWDLETADIDDDGSDDLVGVSRIPNYICWWENPDRLNETWDCHAIANLESSRRSILIQDFDGDSLVDICALPENEFVPGIKVYKQVNSSLDLWKELELDDWTDCVSNLAIITGFDDENRRTFDGLAIEQQGSNSPEFGYFFLDSDYIRREIISLIRTSPYAEFICTGDIDGDFDIDVCTMTQCFENVNDESTWIPHRYLDTASSRLEFSNPFCFDIDGNGTDELVFIESHSIWFVDHARLHSMGELTSHCFEPQGLHNWERLSWESEEPRGTSITMFFKYDQNSNWIGPFAESIDLTEYESGSVNQFQYRVVLKSDSPDISPVLRSVTVEWE